MKIRHAPLVLLVIVAVPLPAFQEENKSPTTSRIRDYDARGESSSAGPAAGPASRALVERRLESARAEKARLDPTGTAWRLTLNDFALPKSLSRERGPMTAPSSGPPERVARDFLRARNRLFAFSTSEIDSLRLLRENKADGLTFLRFEQTVNGVAVFEGQVRVTLDGLGRVVEAGVNSVSPGLDLNTSPSISPEDAVRAALGLLGAAVPARVRRLESTSAQQASFENPNGAQLTAVTTELTVFPLSAGAGALAYRILLEVDGRGWYEILLDADTARLLYLQNLYRNATARVWKQSPVNGPRELVDFPADWIDRAVTVTTGNNVDAYLDTAGENMPDTTNDPDLENGHARSATGKFDFPAGDRNTEQSPTQFKPAAVTSLFYFVNVAHDYYYGLGFDEASGNFQRSNFGRGGAEKDPVLAEAQDGLTLNNANFATPPDGTSPRLQVGLFTFGSSQTNWADADYDGTIILHEYGHGVTDRIVGAGKTTSCLFGTQSAGLSEGWSDYFAASLFNNPVNGAYVSANPYRGERRSSYERYPYTYEDLGNHGFEVHNDGEIWAGTLWDIRKQLGAAVTDKLVVAALRSTPCRPSMPDARDAILAADDNLNDRANRAALWQIFSRHGLGRSATGIDGFRRQGTVFTAAYDLPPDLVPGAQPPLVTSVPLPGVAMGGDFKYTIQAKDPDGGKLTFALIKGPDGMSVDPDTGQVQWRAGFVGAPVQIAITGGQGGRVVHGFFTYVETPLAAGGLVRVSGPERSTGFTTFSVPENTPVLQVTLRGGGGDADLFVYNPDGLLIGSSFRFGSTETLTLPAPKAGAWAVEVVGYRTYSDVALTASLPVPLVLTFPVFAFPLFGDFTSETLYKVTVPASTPVLRLITEGGSGDADLAIHKSTPAVCSLSVAVSAPCVNDALSSHEGNIESVSLVNTAPTDYFIDVIGYQAYAGVTMRSVSGVPTLAVAPSQLAFTAMAGGFAPRQTVRITDAASGPIWWRAAAQTTAAWLRLSLTSGNELDSLDVFPVTAGMSAGSYTGTVTITSAGSTRSPITVAVTLTLR